MTQERVVDSIIEEVRTLGPFRRSPLGSLYAYADPAQAEEGEPIGIYIPVEEVVQRFIARNFPTDWTPARQNHVIEFLKSESHTTFEEVNDPLVPVLNGVLDFTDPQNPTIRPHSPHYGFTAQIPYVYEQDATAPAFEAFIRSCLPEDAIPLLYELIGYTLLPMQFLRKAVLLTGPSGTGKSTLLYALEHLIGRVNTSYVPLQALSNDRFAAADLFGKLANIGGDLDSTEVEATGLFKSLTGDDYVRADVKYGKPIRFRNGATCWFAANEPPPSRDHSDAWRERWIILPFNSKPNKPDFSLKSRITTTEEMQGILRHSVEYLIELLNRGHLEIPTSVQAAHSEFVEQTDHVQAFIQFLRGAAANQEVRRADTFQQYRAWAVEEGIRYTVKKSQFFTRLQEAFGPPHKRKNELYHNIEELNV